MNNMPYLEIPDGLGEPTDEIEIEQQRAAIHAALAKLDPLDAEIMRALHGIDCEEQTAIDIAKQHKVSTDVIDRRKRKLLRELARNLRLSGDIPITTVRTVSPAKGSWAKKTGFWDGRTERDQAKGAPIAPTEGRTNFPVDQMTDDPVRRRKSRSLWTAGSWAWRPPEDVIAALVRGERKIKLARARG